MAVTFAAEHGVGRTDVFTMSPLDIVIDWRKNLSRAGEEPPVDDALIGLAKSMMPKQGPGDTEGGSSGQINPVLVRMLPDRRPELVGGFRRARAALYLIESGLCPDFKLKASKCNLNDAEAALANMDENMQREDPQPIQYAHAVRHLLEDYGMEMKVIAGRLKKSPEYLYSLLKLVSLPTQIQEAVKDGVASVAAAVELSSLPGPVAIQVFNEAKEANGKKVKARDATATAAAGDAAKSAPKSPQVNSADIRKVKQAKVDAAINSGVAAPVAAKRRPIKEVLEFFESRSNEPSTTPDGKKVAKVIAKYIRGEATEDMLLKFWDKQFIIK